MEGFKKLPKMQCYKEGGSVMAKNMFKSKDVESGDSDMAQDKKLIKKAFKQHDKAEHDKEPTEIKLKKGGRSKKEAGTVKKYNAGGNINESMKAAGALDMLKKIKPTGKKKAMAPSKAVEKPMMSGIDNMPAMKKGKSVKKYKEGGSIKNMADGRTTGQMSDMEGRGMQREGMPPMEETPQQRMARIEKAKRQAQSLSSLPQAAGPQAPQPPMAPPQGMAPPMAPPPMGGAGVKPIPGPGAMSAQEQQMLMQGGM